jgi:exonuclease VII small subunit
MTEYEENKSNSSYQNAKQRLNHLHEMLSHVKHLVQEYDTSNAKQQQPSYPFTDKLMQCGPCNGLD